MECATWHNIDLAGPQESQGHWRVRVTTLLNKVRKRRQEKNEVTSIEQMQSNQYELFVLFVSVSLCLLSRHPEPKIFVEPG